MDVPEDQQQDQFLSITDVLSGAHAVSRGLEALQVEHEALIAKAREGGGLLDGLQIRTPPSLPLEDKLLSFTPLTNS